MGFERTLRIGLYAAAVAVTGVARAEGGDTVLLGATCLPDGATPAEVLPILAAELSPLRVELLTAQHSDPADPVLAIDGCDPVSATAKISVFRGGEHRERVIQLSDVTPSTRSRTLALALAEALRDPTATEPAEPPAPALPPPEPAPAQPPPRTSVKDAGALAVAHDGPRWHPTGAIRAGAAVRYLPASTTPALVLNGELTWDRFAAGLAVEGARGSVDLGAATLLAFVAQATYDALALSDTLWLRARGELGVALGLGSPSSAAVSHTHDALHAALLGGVATALWAGTAADVELFLAGGYASSLTAKADGRAVAGLGGGLVSLELATRF